MKPGSVLSCDKDIKVTVMAVIPAAVLGCLYRENPKAAVLVGYLPQRQWGLFVTACTSHRTIPKSVSFNQA